MKIKFCSVLFSFLILQVLINGYSQNTTDPSTETTTTIETTITTATTTESSATTTTETTTESSTTKPTTTTNITATTKTTFTISVVSIVLISVFSALFLIAIIIIIILIRKKKITLTCLRKLKYKKKELKKATKKDQSIRDPNKFDDLNKSIQSFEEPEDVLLENIETEWLIKHANSDLIYYDEYKALPDFRSSKTCNYSDNNPTKDRFIDIKSYDHSRVILQDNTWYNGVNCDYINANFIQGYSHPKKFIATQGPLNHTTSDFWHMIWQYRVHAIIMLTNLIENSMEKCAQYWPDVVGRPSKYGDVEVCLKEEKRSGEYLKRTFDVKSKSARSEALKIAGSIKEAKPFVVTQYFYNEWPDRNTPTTDPISLLYLIRDVNKNHPVSQYPILVHCSAGVGRTGTYITLDSMFDRLKIESKCNVFNFIKQIRENRVCLVQTSSQYVFIHEALYEYSLFGFTSIETARLVNYYKQLEEKGQKLEEEFQVFF
jgi:protein tyrosine phosphatase